MGSAFKGREMAGSDKFKSAFGDMTTANQDAGMGGPDKRGGLFGSGIGKDMNGEDFVTMLSRAAALAQGDYGGAAQIGQTMGRDKRDAAQRAAEREDYRWKKQTDQEFQGPPNNDTVNDYNFILQNEGPEAAKQYLQGRYDPVVNVPLGNGSMYIGPRSGMDAALRGGAPQGVPDRPIGKLTPITGGDAGNGVGGFPRWRR